MHMPQISRRNALKLILLTATPTPFGAYAPAQAATTAPDAVDWLIARQNKDGGFGAQPGVSTSDITADVVLALAANNRRINAVQWPARISPLRYLRTQVKRLNAPESAIPAKWVLALTAAGEDPRKFGGVDFVAATEQALALQIGKEDVNPRVMALSIRALHAIKKSPADDVLQSLARQRLGDGGWRVDASAPSDPATTSIVVRALAGSRFSAAGNDTDATIAYMKAIQNADGGFARAWRRGPTNAVSTALALQALESIGARPELLSASNGNPLTALSALRQPDSAFALSPGQSSDLLATAAVTSVLIKP
jgi:hypothetical protein